jgi:phospholipase C
MEEIGQKLGQGAQGAITRRGFLVHGAGALAAGALAERMLGYGALRRRSLRLGIGAPRAPLPSQVEALRVLGRARLRGPDSLPFPSLAMGTDTLPEIEHVVVLMLENHSYDNLFGMLGRAPGRFPRGDGFTLGVDGYPTASNPYPNGRLQRAFHMPSTCQLPGKPSQEWAASHIQYANGRNDGFVISPSGPVAMGYWEEQDLPFTYGLALQFPIGDRWFCSLLGQTDPNRRYLIAATSTGMTDDIGTSPGGIVPDGSLGAPASNGTIFDRLKLAGISWADYDTSFPTGATMELYPSNDGAFSETNAKPIAQFFADAASGRLPAFSLLDPNYSTQSQENPQNIVVGEAFLAKVVAALGSSPAWRRTLLILTYDEHGGYYDHVPPPVALAPDDVPPQVQPGESTYDGFHRYGFRVPSVLIGPYAKRNHVSHAVYDHTSILAFLERKWNLPALTYRDANANDLTDFLDLPAMAAQRPTFPELPKLPAPGDTAAALRCSTTGPGTIPPPSPTPVRPMVELRGYRLDRPRHALMLDLNTNGPTLTNVLVELYRDRRRVASHRLERLGAAPRAVPIRHRRGAPPPGHYALVVRSGRRLLLRRSVRIR